MISNYEIKRCIKSIDEYVAKKTLKNKWDCISFCRGWFEQYDAIPISVIEYIANLYITDIIK